MTHHMKAAKLIRALVVELEALAEKAQGQVDDGPNSGSRLEMLEERRDIIEEATTDLLEVAEYLELVP
jgi:hypothetical protein